MAAGGRLYILRIEIDGHYHGSSTVPRPWVARIDGPDSKFGLRRDFVRPMNDWQDAHRACSGNLYGVIATFALRGGHLYEVSRLRGSSSKRHQVREFLRITDEGKLVQITTDDALAIVDDDAGGVATFVDMGDTPETWAAEVRGLGTPRRLGFVVDGSHRRFRLRDGGVFELVEDGSRRLAGVRDRTVVHLTEEEALSWLRG